MARRCSAPPAPGAAVAPPRPPRRGPCCRRPAGVPPLHEPGAGTAPGPPPAPARQPPAGAGASFVIDPTGIDVVGSPDKARPGDKAPPGAMLTLTTCHPKGSAAKRLIVQAALVTAPGAPAPSGA